MMYDFNEKCLLWAVSPGSKHSPHPPPPGSGHPEAEEPKAISEREQQAVASGL